MIRKMQQLHFSVKIDKNERSEPPTLVAKHLFLQCAAELMEMSTFARLHLSSFGQRQNLPPLEPSLGQDFVPPLMWCFRSTTSDPQADEEAERRWDAAHFHD